MKVDGVQASLQSSGIGQGSREIKPQITQNKEDFLPRERQVKDEQVVKAIEKANKSFQPFDRKFERSVHERTNTVMIKVIDASTDEVIREIPPEKLLDMVANMLEVAGILVDTKI